MDFRCQFIVLITTFSLNLIHFMTNIRFNLKFDVHPNQYLASLKLLVSCKFDKSILKTCLFVIVKLAERMFSYLINKKRHT